MEIFYENERQQREEDLRDQQEAYYEDDHLKFNASLLNPDSKKLFEHFFKRDSVLGNCSENEIRQVRKITTYANHKYHILKKQAQRKLTESQSEDFIKVLDKDMERLATEVFSIVNSSRSREGFQQQTMITNRIQRMAIQDIGSNMERVNRPNPFAWVTKMFPKGRSRGDVWR